MDLRVSEPGRAGFYWEMNKKLKEPESVELIDVEFEAWLRSGEASAPPSASEFLREVIRLSAKHEDYYFACEMEKRCEWLKKAGCWWKALKDWNSLARIRFAMLKQFENENEVTHMMWPARELVQISSDHPLSLYSQRWADAGGKFHAGRMVALSGSEVWSNFSDFGCPHEPFDRANSVSTRSVALRDAEKMGLVEPLQIKKKSFLRRLFGK